MDYEQPAALEGLLRPIAADGGLEGGITFAAGFSHERSQQRVFDALAPGCAAAR